MAQEIPPEAVLINRMIMKDNDAGLIKRQFGEELSSS
jgi:hypothetical protein